MAEIVKMEVKLILRKMDNLTGRRFGRLTVLEVTDKRSGTSPIWVCRCDCGNTTEVRRKNLISGITQSCGCLRAEYYAQRRTHGGYRTRLYGVWNGMITRCTNPNAVNYKDYGGRGIQICDEWRHDFQAFFDWAIANGYDENAPRGKCTLDRIDTNGDYTPENCRFVSMATQIQNRRPRNKNNQ